MGAGVAGCATAIMLKQTLPQLHVRIIDKGLPVNNKKSIGETLPPQSSQLLKQLGLWDRFLACNFLKSYGTSSTWGSGELYQNEFIYSPFGNGWHLDRNKFDHMIREEALSIGVKIDFSVSLSDVIKNNNSWKIKCKSTITSRTAYKAGFIIDATGRKAMLASKLGSDKLKVDKLVGYYQFYPSKKTSSLGNGACVESDELGWWYSAGLPNNELVIGFMTDSDIGHDFQLKEHANLFSMLQNCQYTKQRVEQSQTKNEVIPIAASSQVMSPIIGENWLAVGDAASTYDPISSSGIFKSLAMSRFAAYAIIDALKGNLLGFKRYKQMVEKDFEDYLKKRQKYYAEEKRFSSSTFWQRRIEDPASILQQYIYK